VLAHAYARALRQTGQLDEAWAFALQAVEAAAMDLQFDLRLLWSQDDASITRGEANDLSIALGEADINDISRFADHVELLGEILQSQGDNPIPMYLRANYLFALVGAEKSKRRVWYLLQLNRARDPAQRASVHEGLTELLDAARWHGTVSLLLDLTAALIALDRLMGRVDDADGLLRSMDNQSALLDQVNFASGIMNLILNSDRVVAFVNHELRV
jgi:hypothetical protein